MYLHLLLLVLQHQFNIYSVMVHPPIEQCCVRSSSGLSVSYQWLLTVSRVTVTSVRQIAAGSRRRPLCWQVLMERLKFCPSSCALIAYSHRLLYLERKKAVVDRGALAVVRCIVIALHGVNIYIFLNMLMFSWPSVRKPSVNVVNAAAPVSISLWTRNYMKPALKRILAAYRLLCKLCLLMRYVRCT